MEIQQGKGWVNILHVGLPEKISYGWNGDLQYPFGVQDVPGLQRIGTGRFDIWREAVAVDVCKVWRRG